MLVLAITGTVVVAQVIGGLASGSLALLADAGHMLSDTTGLAIALTAASLALRPATTRRTFGWRRAEVLAAALNAAILAGVGIGILVAAVRRWSEPPDVRIGVMTAVAAGGALANLAGLLVLRGGNRDSLNLRGAYLEVLGDLLGSMAVIVAGIVMWLTGWRQADAVASVLIATLILPRAWWLLRDTLDVLMEATPRGVNLAVVRDHIRQAPDVVDVHDLHAWTITSGLPVVSAHVVVDESCVSTGRMGEVLDHLAECLDGHFDVEHCTFQLEPIGHRAHEAESHA